MNVRTAKKLVDKKDPVIWEILENILKGHPVMLNRAPTLHRVSIQAFQPRLVEGKAIQLHPLVCGAFNADFDGDQMAVHVPLGHAAILEAQMFMLSAHYMLNPQDGSPVTLPSHDMILGLYYLTKPKKSTAEVKVNGEGSTFYSAEEVVIAFNEGVIDLHAVIKVRSKTDDSEGNLVIKIIETTVGRVIFNQSTPAIPIGKTIALVGVSGVGKSTIADLVPRFYDVKIGAVLVDGIDVRDYKMESFRSHMSFVTQETFLFNDTIFNNIAIGKPDATEEEVIAAARIANAHEFILQTEDGYQTTIGDRGIRLSGGQRQRLCIARAVFKNPSILILDEATSALDTESERIVQDALSKLMKGRTTLVIAHRLSTIKEADEIIVIT